MQIKKREIVFLCGARDFHAMDWYRSAEEILPKNRLSILTDLIAGESFKKIITEKDNVQKLLIIDRFLFKNQSRTGDIWRNIVKLLVLPIQVFLLKRHSKKSNIPVIYYAHSMYYIWLAYLANVKFIGTPQGSDILVKPFKSKFYRFLSKKSLRAAEFITVDSEKMKTKCEEISSTTPFIIQNGIDMRSIQNFYQKKISIKEKSKRDKITSIRGYTELYRIKEILLSRGNREIPITFIYPFYDSEYKKEVKEYLIDSDVDLGRLDRFKMYKLFHESQMIISIPSSDSSPRSVYEAIFCGSPVCITHHPYYDSLPDCIKERIVLVDLNDKNWFIFALEKAKVIAKNEFSPSQEAIDLFDQRKSFKIILKLIDQ